MKILEIPSWKSDILKVFKPIRYPKISITIYADASLEGWSAYLGNVSTGGTWLPDEKLMHINFSPIVICKNKS